MLTDVPSLKEKKGTPNRSIRAETNKRWSDQQKTEAVQTYLLLGNLAMTGRVLGIPEITLKVWKRSEWWAELVREQRSQERMQLTARTKKIVDAALTVVEDRLNNGDFQFDQKTGQTIRKPVNLKDAHKVAVDLQERADKLESLEDKPVQEEAATEDKLLKLAEKFAEMATKKIEQKQLDNRTIDVEDVIARDSSEGRVVGS